MQKLAYTVAEKHGRLFVPSDRVDLLTRSGRAYWSFVRLQITAEIFVAKNIIFTMLDVVTAGGGIAKSTDAAKAVVDKTSNWLLTDAAGGQYGFFPLPRSTPREGSIFSPVSW